MIRTSTTLRRTTETSEKQGERFLEDLKEFEQRFMGSKYDCRLMLDATKRNSTEGEKSVAEIRCTGHLRRKGPENDRNYKIIIIMQKKLLDRRFYRFFIFLPFRTVDPHF
jgi:hypothetical protein